MATLSACRMTLSLKTKSRMDTFCGISTSGHFDLITISSLEGWVFDAADMALLRIDDLNGPNFVAWKQTVCSNFFDILLVRSSSCFSGCHPANDQETVRMDDAEKTGATVSKGVK